MKKVKEFIKEHKWVIVNGAVMGALCGLSCYAGYEYCLRHEPVLADGIIKDVLNNSVKQYGNVSHVYGRAIQNGGYKPSELGQLGKDMIKVGVPADKVFTHFIVIGSPDKK